MTRTRITIGFLIVLLLSNAFWLYQLLDASISLDHRSVSLERHREALVQALAILPVAASPGASRDEVIAAARTAAGTSQPFEKEGFLWVGRLGLRFGPEGRLLEATPSWSPFPGEGSEAP